MTAYQEMQLRLVLAALEDGAASLRAAYTRYKLLHCSGVEYNQKKEEVIHSTLELALNCISQMSGLISGEVEVSSEEQKTRRVIEI